MAFRPYLKIVKKNWSNLQKMLCPICAKALMQKPSEPYVWVCSDEMCTFGIKESKLSVLLGKPARNNDGARDNFYELQNLGLSELPPEERL